MPILFDKYDPANGNEFQEALLPEDIGFEISGNAVAEEHFPDTIENNVMLNYLLNRFYRGNTSRFENLQVTKKTVGDNFAAGVLTSLHFANEIIHGDLFYQKGGWVTTFKAQKAGCYAVAACADIIVEFLDKVPIDTMTFASVDLRIYKNGIHYSTIDIVERDIFREEQISNELIVHIEGTRFYLSGTDIVTLEIGDEIDLRIAPSMPIYLGNTVTHVSSYGFFNVTWQDDESEQIATATPTWYYE